MIIAKLLSLPMSYYIIPEMWCKILGYAEYIKHCHFYGCEPIDEKLYQVYYDALQEEYVCVTPVLGLGTSRKQSFLP